MAPNAGVAEVDADTRAFASVLLFLFLRFCILREAVTAPVTPFHLDWRISQVFFFVRKDVAVTVTVDLDLPIHIIPYIA